MPKKKFNLMNVAVVFFCLVATTMFFSCKKDDAKQITAFSFTSLSAVGIINESAKTINIDVPVGTNVTKLAPSISVSEKATVNPASGVAQNFTNPVFYTVTAEDGSTTTYTVIVAIGSPSQKQITMTVKQNNVALEIAYTGTMTIDWGDGTAIETYPIPNTDSLYFHDYKSSSSFNIIITGDITYLDCSYNGLTHINVCKNTTLTYLNCSYNYLTSLDVSENTALTHLDCSQNLLTNLDISKNIALKYLDCAGNVALTSLDVTKNAVLTYLNCRMNGLTNLDVSKNTALTYLECFWNSLTNLDVSKNIALDSLNCGYNKITNLNVTNNTSLKYLYCFSNDLTTKELDALFGTLHSNAISGGKKIFVGKNPGSNDCDRSIAENKGWLVDVWI